MPTKVMDQKLMIVFNDLDIGGIQRKIVDICLYLEKNHPEVSVTICIFQKKGIFVSQIPPKTNLEILSFHTTRLNLFWQTIWLAWQILKHNPTHVLSFMDLGSVPAFFASKIFFWRKIEIIIGEDILTSKYINVETHPSFRLKIIKSIYPLVSKILVQTLAQKQDLIKIIGSNSRSKICISPNWLPLTFSSPPSSSKPRITDILFIGRLDTQKNLYRFIEIVRTVIIDFPNLKAKIVGDGPQFEEIKSLIKKENLQSNITIHHSVSNPSKLYLTAKAFLLTSDYEGFPLTIMEAISCGCHPIVNNLGEIRPFFDHYPNDFIYHHNFEAIKLIKKALLSPSQHLHFYQQKIAREQPGLIAKYVDLTLYT